MSKKREMRDFRKNMLPFYHKCAQTYEYCTCCGRLVPIDCLKIFRRPREFKICRSCLKLLEERI